MKKTVMRLFAMGMVVATGVMGLAAPASAHHSTPRIISAWGDSFSSGEGGVPYLAGSDTTDDQCHRSATSFSKMISALPGYKLTANVACSGATTGDVLATTHFTELPQAGRIDPASSRTIGMIGGNNVAFGTLLGCFLTLECTQTPVPQTVEALLQQLPAQLDVTYQAIKAAAPNAVHIVVLYPPLLPSNGADLTACPELSAEEVAFGNQFQAQLNAVIAQRAGANGFRVANPGSLFVGHSVCSTNSWFYRPGTVPAAATYHPTFAGRVALAAATVPNL